MIPAFTLDCTFMVISFKSSVGWLNPAAHDRDALTRIEAQQPAEAHYVPLIRAPFLILGENESRHTAGGWIRSLLEQVRRVNEEQLKAGAELASSKPLATPLATAPGSMSGSAAPGCLYE